MIDETIDETALALPPPICPRCGLPHRPDFDCSALRGDHLKDKTE
jgi:hypothetical protein